MKKIFTLPNLYVLLWALYYTQGTFLPMGSIWSRGVLVLFLLISVYFCLQTVTRLKQPLYFKSLNVLLLMFTIYGVIHIVVGGGVGYLQMIYLSLLPIYTFYVLTKNGKIDEWWLRIVFFIAAGVVLIQYVSYVNHLEETFQEAENATINIGYDIVALLPLVWFWRKKPIVQYVLLALVLGLVITTVKRGAIIVSAICTLYFLYNTMQHSSQKTQGYVWLVALVFVVIGVRYVINFYENSEFAQMRMAYTLEGESSGRDSIFRQSWNIFLNSDIIGILIGHGAFATIRIIRIAAHNDWLEILVNNGLLGVTLYMFYWVNFYKTFKKDRNIETKTVIGTVMIIYFASTLFSMSYYAMTLPSTLALGYSLAKQQTITNNIRNK